MENLRELPKLRDSLSYLYIEHAIVNRKDSAIECIDKDGAILIPVANLCVFMLGPGTSITHAAVRVLADSGCTIVWTGEEMTRFYAAGTGETRKAYHLIRQAELCSNPEKREQVVRNMYEYRFSERLESGLSLPQIRGLEGIRVREAYAQASEKYGVAWHGRKYDRENWDKGDPINRALSTANALLNNICHAAIVSGGYSPALGFIHTGKQLSFVYDIADLYKTEITIPTAFEVISKFPGGGDREVRTACRAKIREVKLLERILPDIDRLLGIKAGEEDSELDIDPGLPTELWEGLFTEIGGQKT